MYPNDSNMMIQVFFCLLTFLPGTTSEVHPFHISVTDIVHKPEEKAIQMTVRLFLDDMEQGLRVFTGNEELDIYDRADSVFLSETLGKYILQNLSLSTKKPLELQYLGFEYDQDVIWCYLEVKKVKPFTQLQISNRILNDTFDDQENLVHIQKNGKVKSLRLSKTDYEEVLTWEKKK